MFAHVSKSVWVARSAGKQTPMALPCWVMKARSCFQRFECSAGDHTHTHCGKRAGPIRRIVATIELSSLHTKTFTLRCVFGLGSGHHRHAASVSCCDGSGPFGRPAHCCAGWRCPPLGVADGAETDVGACGAARRRRTGVSGQVGAGACTISVRSRSSSAGARWH